MNSLVRNERLKLGATLLNTGAASCSTVGVATPLAAAFYNLGGFGTSLGIATLLIGIALRLFATLTLHFIARMVLGGLE